MLLQLSGDICFFCCYLLEKACVPHLQKQMSPFRINILECQMFNAILRTSFHSYGFNRKPVRTMPAKEIIKTIISKLSGKEKIFFLLLTVVAGIIVLWPLHNFQHYLTQGDHGRDLYCFKKTLEGSLPYRDYSWLFGPLMPYYYSLCYILGGISIQSVLLGQGLLILLAGVLIYLICAVFLSPAISFVCAFWYWGFRGTEFFYTYNHIGGVVTLLITLYCLFRYIRKNNQVYIYAGFISILLFMLIRLNMGASTLLAFVSSLFFVDLIQKNPQASRQRRLYAFLSLAVLVTASLIYWFLLYPLPDYAIYQSFPYGKSQRTDASASVIHTIISSGKMLASYFTATLAQKIFGVLLLLAALQSSILIFLKKSPQELKRNLILMFGSLFIFFALSSHEYFASGVYYRSFWFFPLIFIIIFHLISIATKNIPSSIIKAVILLTLFLPPFWNIQHTNRMIQSFKNPLHMLHIGKNKIYTMQHPRWFRAVGDAVDFIKKNTRPDEKILVLPLDPLYLFLSERDSATRQLVFFEHINIPEEQEKATIDEMESTGANWAIISNRAHSLEGGMGTFGKTYCLLIAQYLEDHFTPVATFGNWDEPGGWAWNHSVRILKRNP